MPFVRSLHDPSAAPRPTWWRAAILRFGLVYWTLFCTPVIATQIPGLRWTGAWLVVPAVNAIVQRLAGWVFGITAELSVADNGSGDRLGIWMFVVFSACAALIAAAVWTLLDRRRAHDLQLRSFLRVLIRYTLAFAMLVFGVAKLLVLQFPAPGMSQLLRRFGEASPMGLLWTFMGASPVYVFFSGAAETLGAALLLFRRTTALGALVLVAVMTNVVLLNFCYDVCVKVHSAHYLAMSVYLLLPDLGRLASVLVLARPTQPPPRPPAPRSRRLRIGRRLLKLVVITALVVANLREMLEQRTALRPFIEPTTWYDATWRVTAFTRDGVDVPPLVTDRTRWKHLVLWADTERSYLRWRLLDDSRGDRFTLVVDDRAGTMTATPEGKDSAAADRFVLHYTRVDAKHLTVQGKLGGAEVAATLERFDRDDLLLVNRGFHWVSEAPFSR